MGKSLNTSFAVNTLVKLTEKKSKKKDKQITFSGQKIPLNKLIGKTLRKSSKKQYQQILGANIDGFVGEVNKLYKKGGKSKLFDDKEDLFETLTEKKFCKSLCGVLKKYKDTSKGIPDCILVAIGDMFVSGTEGFSDENISKPYLKLVDAAKEKKIKNLAKEMDAPKGKALGFILTSISMKGLDSKTSIRRINSFLELLTSLPDLTEKRAKKIIKYCYKSKDLNFFLGIALNEKPKKDNENFSIVTNAILSILEKLDKDDRNDILKKYAKRRKDLNCKCPRRVNLLSLNEDDYKNINKTISKLLRSGYKEEIFK